MTTAVTAAPLADFPWPFRSDAYHYSANVEPAPLVVHNASGEWGDRLVVLDDEAVRELPLRRRILERDPGRQALLPHMRPAVWEALDWVLARAAEDNPAVAEYTVVGERRHWADHLTGDDVWFTMGRDDEMLGGSPLVLLGGLVQEDVAVLDQREDDLFVDAGVVLFASNWSLNFDAGMSFLEIHGPVPRDYADGAMPRALRFLLRLGPNQAYRRVNWTSTIGHRMDLSLEGYADWGVERGRDLDLATLADRFNLRVEVQHLIRLPRTGAVLFLIHTYLAPLRSIMAVPGWAAQFRSVLESAPLEMIAYKGLGRLRDPLMRLLADASPTGGEGTGDVERENGGDR